VIRVLFVGAFPDAQGLGKLLGSNGSVPYQITHVDEEDLSAERICAGEADVLLLDLGSKRSQGGELVQAARDAAPDLPVVVLSDSDDETLAVESLRHGAQDFLPKRQLNRTTLARSLRYSIERHHLQKTLQSLSLIDDLTGLHNRRGFLALAEQHLRVILRKGSAMLVYLDLDNLKTINDTFGHLEGNRALVVTANMLRACFRQSDILARLGGDEFAVLMTDAGKDSEQQVRKRLQQRVELTNALPPRDLRISFSIGFANVPSIRQPSLEELLQIADERMYDEKRNKHLRAPLAPVLKQTTVV
jgi:diguanylate cyclase (GGDEF)-like protein